MASVDTAAPRSGKKARSIKRNASGVRVDMTRWWMLRFCCYFFMFTTTLTQPQVMEITMPPNTESIKVPESDLLTLIVRKDLSHLLESRSNPAELCRITD